MQHAPRTHGPGHSAWIDTPGEKLHIDLAGPTDPTLHDDHYVLIGFDEGSEYLKALPLRNKTPVEVKRVYIRGYGGERKPAKILRCDNGGGFQREFLEYTTSQGTQMENSLAGRPSTNSRIEDKVRRILEGTRATMLVAGVVYSFRGYAVVVAAKTSPSRRSTATVRFPTRR